VGIRETFDQAAQSYDRARRQLVSCFDDFYATTVGLIRQPREASFSVLDLGAGTGLLSLFVAEAFPNARFTLMDVSAEMLAVARERFAGDGERFCFVVQDYSTAPISGEYAVIVSGLSIHHLSGADKQRLFRALYRCVQPGGAFINADQVLGPTAEIEQAYHDQWLSQARARGASEADLRAAVERMKEDKMSTLESQLAWLRDAGFQGVHCWYQNYSYVVYSGVK
jgi:tRNA (cmo5U34)-methyltransferase